jgi:hypothetical protein
MSGLNGKQDRAIAVLLTAPSIAAAADTLGVNERTLYRWLDDPAFRASYLVARREAFSQAVAQLQTMAAEGATVLLSIATDPTKPAHARVAAVRTMFEYGSKWIELEELEQRLSALEARIQ